MLAHARLPAGKRQSLRGGAVYAVTMAESFSKQSRPRGCTRRAPRERMCTHCGLPFWKSPCRCGNHGSVPYLNRRPILLEEELEARVEEALVAAQRRAKSLSAGGARTFVLRVVLPYWLSLLREGRLARRRHRAGDAGGYRELYGSADEQFAFLRRGLPSP